jgi:hypothetical protein
VPVAVTLLKLRELLRHITSVSVCVYLITGNFSHHHRVQNGSGAHPASYPMGTRGSFLGGKSGRSVKLTTHLRLVPRSKNVWNYTSTPPICLLGVVLNLKKKAQGQFYLLRLPYFRSLPVLFIVTVLEGHFIYFILICLVSEANCFLLVGEFKICSCIQHCQNITLTSV